MGLVSKQCLSIYLLNTSAKVKKLEDTQMKKKIGEKVQNIEVHIGRGQCLCIYPPLQTTKSPPAQLCVPTDNT